MGFLFFYISILSYALFFLVSILIRVGNNNSPLGSFNRLHFKITSLYILISGFCYWLFHLEPQKVFLDFLIGLFLYFSFHYSIFLNFFALAQRSISASILILLFDHDGKLTKKEILEKYANGKGFKYIKETRIEDLLKLGWLEKDKNDYIVTKKGFFTIKLVKYILKFWGLSQLGKS